MAANLSFALALVLVCRGNGPMAAASLLLIVPVPMLIGALAGMQSMLKTYFQIATGGTPDPLMLPETISSAFVAPLIGLILMLPVYLVASIGTFARTFSSRAKSAD